jgi:type II secretory pathway pseudopilin PulG
MSRSLGLNSALRRHASFTLIEVLVSMVILALLIIVMTQVLTLADNTWMSGEASKERMQNERAIGNFIVSEMRMALLPTGRRAINSLQFVVNPAGVTSSSYGNFDSVFWQAPIATDTTYGDVAEVGYFIQWNTSNPQNPQAVLSRFFVNPPSSTAGSTSYLIYSQPTAWISNALIQTVAPANSANSYQGFFAANVVGLWVQCLDSNGVQLTSDYYGHALANDAYDSRNGYTDSHGVQSPSYITTNSSGSTTVAPYCALPRMVSLSLVLLDSQAARRIGPTQMSTIQSLATSSAASTTPANSFVTSALSSPNLAAIKRGFRPFQTVIYLEGSQ